VKRLAEVRVPDLIAFQDEAYAKRYADVIKRVVAAEHRPCRAPALSEAAARYLYKLMAYKDEFEVARLHTDPAFLAELDAQFPHGYSVKYNLAPPLLADKDPKTGHLQKKQYGQWMFKAFQRLAGLKSCAAARSTSSARPKSVAGAGADRGVHPPARRDHRASSPTPTIPPPCAGRLAGRDPRLRPREGEEPGQGPADPGGTPGGLPESQPGGDDEAGVSRHGAGDLPLHPVSKQSLSAAGQEALLWGRCGASFARGAFTGRLSAVLS
jgi:hypothetical protein